LEPDAAAFAAIRADALLDAGDLEGSAVWRSIAKEIEKLQAEKPSARRNAFLKESRSPSNGRCIRSPKIASGLGQSFDDAGRRISSA
jgi:hypothetical protein